MWVIDPSAQNLKAVSCSMFRCRAKHDMLWPMLAAVSAVQVAGRRWGWCRMPLLAAVQAHQVVHLMCWKLLGVTEQFVRKGTPIHTVRQVPVPVRLHARGSQGTPHLTGSLSRCSMSGSLSKTCDVLWPPR